jgi:hypothetical protein
VYKVPAQDDFPDVQLAARVQDSRHREIFYAWFGVLTS